MENKTVGKNVALEHVAVSGILYVTVDKEPLYTHKFKECVKLKIVFDDADEDIVKHQNQLRNIEIQDDKVKIEPTEETDYCEEDNFIDDTLALNFDTTTEKRHNNQELPVIQEDQCVCEKTKKVSKIRKNKAASKVVASNRRTPYCIRPKKNVSTQNDSDSSKTEETELKEEKNQHFDLSEENASDEEMYPKANKSHRKIKKKLETPQDICCPYCSQCFKSRKEFSFHRKAERKNYPCIKCRKVLKFKAHLILHMREHNEIGVSHVVSNSEPDSIGEKASSESEKSKKNMRDLKCNICGSTMSNLANLKIHTMSHTGEHAYKCCVCGQELRTVGPYNKHMASHAKFGQVQCKICKSTFSNRAELSRHQLTHTFQCDLCGQVFPNKTGRYFHYKTFHKSDILKCPKCGRLYSCKTALASHLKYHQNRHRTQCTVCGLLVFRLDKHMLSHTVKSGEHNIESSIFVCDKCPKQFTQKYLFQRHLRIHSEEKPYTCTECSKQFASSGGLSRHMITHMKEKPFVCEVCGKACSQLGNLKIHMQTHKESKVLQCGQCGLEFTQKNALQEHIDKVHPGANILQTPEAFFQTNTIYRMYFE